MLIIGTADGGLFLDKVTSAAAYAAGELLAHNTATNERVSQAPLEAGGANPSLVVGVAWDAATGAGEAHFMVPMNSVGIVNVVKDAAGLTRGTQVGMSTTTNGRLTTLGGSARFFGNPPASNAAGAGTLARVRLSPSTV